MAAIPLWAIDLTQHGHSYFSAQRNIACGVGLM